MAKLSYRVCIYKPRSRKPLFCRDEATHPRGYYRAPEDVALDMAKAAGRSGLIAKIDDGSRIHRFKLHTVAGNPAVTKTGSRRKR